MTRAASPQTSSLDVRFGLYQPQVDREFDATNKSTPYKSVLDDSDWEVGGALDFRVWHDFGELAVGLGLIPIQARTTLVNRHFAVGGK